MYSFYTYDTFTEAVTDHYHFYSDIGKNRCINFLHCILVEHQWNIISISKVPLIIPESILSTLIHVILLDCCLISIESIIFLYHLYFYSFWSYYLLLLEG